MQQSGKAGTYAADEWDKTGIRQGLGAGSTGGGHSRGQMGLDVG